jgi:hypothetical protein
VEYILGDEWDSEKITVVDNGDYQGTKLFLIPKVGYQPEEYEYLMTYVGYGTCSGCDTLLEIQSYSYDNDLPTEQQLKDYMTLCKHLVDNMIKPYNTGWRNDPRFNTIEAESVKHSRWDTAFFRRLENELASYTHFCPECKYLYRDLRVKGHNYCPNCGARMDGDSNG